MRGDAETPERRRRLAQWRRQCDGHGRFDGDGFASDRDGSHPDDGSSVHLRHNVGRRHDGLWIGFSGAVLERAQRIQVPVQADQRAPCRGAIQGHQGRADGAGELLEIDVQARGRLFQPGILALGNPEQSA
jgi:hypothetical protein